MLKASFGNAEAKFNGALVPGTRSEVIVFATGGLKFLGASSMLLLNYHETCGYIHYLA